MPRIQALSLGPDGPEPVRLDVDGRTLVDQQSDAGGSEPTHWLARAPLNAHTHVGDAFLTGRVPQGSLRDLVAPPDGFKHRELAKADEDVVVAGIVRALEEYAAVGSRRILDFREGGAPGLSLLRRARAAARISPAVTALGRPVAEDPEGAAALAGGDGFGVSSLEDASRFDLEGLAEAAARAGKPFAIHVSEEVREPIEDALALSPSLLIHLCEATQADVRRVVDEDVPVAVCPTSNRRFGRKAPIPFLVESGARWAFGTDNAMFGSRSVVEEAAVAARLFPEMPQETWVAALEASGFEARLKLPQAAPAWILLPLDPAGRIQWWEPVRPLGQPPNRHAVLRPGDA